MKSIMVVFAFLSALPVHGQDFDLKFLDKFASKSSNNVDVALDGSLLQMASRLLSGSDPEQARIKKVVAGLKGIYVKSFEFEKEGEYTEADVSGVRALLKGPNWSRIVGVKNKKDTENAEIYVQTAGANRIGGLAIIATSPKELTVVHILGSINLDDLSLLADYGVPQVDLGPGKGSHKDSK